MFGCNALMKISFAPGLPEQTAKENQQLKSQLQLTKQQLSDLQARLADTISSITTDKALRLPPAEAASHLFRLVKQQHSELKSAQHHAELARRQQEQLQKQNIALKKAIAEREIEIATLKKYVEEEERKNGVRVRQLEGELFGLQQCNGRLLQELQSARLQKVKLQGKQDAGGEENSLQSLLRNELVRAVLQRQQFQNKLQLKINEIARSERDKEALEQYYDQKWNSQYKKVKIKLEQTYNLKIAELEEQTQLRMLFVENSLRELQEEQTYYLSRNEELEYRFNVDQQHKETLANNIAQLTTTIEDLNARSVENNLMFREEVRSIKVHFSQEAARFIDTKARLQSAVQCEKQKLNDFKRYHEQKSAQTERRHQAQLQSQTAVFSKEREVLVGKYEREMEELKRDIFQELDNAQIIKNQAEREFHSTLEQIQAEHARLLAQKEEEYNRNNLRWIDKHCELENLLAINRRKYDEEIQRKANELQTHIEKQQSLHRQIDQFTQTIAHLQANINELEEAIDYRDTQLSKRDSSIAGLEKVLAHTKQEVEMLLSNRKLWKNELLDVGRQFTQTFEDLKKTHDKQILLFKARIAELEEMNNKNISNQRQIDMIQKIKQQRSPYKTDIHIREAENLILHKVKDYYETKLNQEQEIVKTSFKNSHAILARKLKKNRAYVNEATSYRVIEPKPVDKGRYCNSAQKQYNLSLSRGKLKEGFERLRVQTMSSFK